MRRNDTVRRALHSLDTGDRFARFQNVLSLLPGKMVDSLFADGVLPHDAGDAIQESWAQLVPQTKHLDELGAFQFLEIRSPLPDELLMYADKLSMAHSLECRVPYLDEDVVEYAERLDASFKVRRGKRKFVHKRVCGRYLPETIMRRKKRGFAVNVVDDWFRKSLTGRLEASLRSNETHMSAILRMDRIRELAQAHAAGAADNHKILFSLVMLEAWFEQFAA
jgi:asparagine synthase (glutamine-hydrolysing)